jgi:hypothetical protein
MIRIQEFLIRISKGVMDKLQTLQPEQDFLSPGVKTEYNGFPSSEGNGNGVQHSLLDATSNGKYINGSHDSSLNGVNQAYSHTSEELYGHQIASDKFEVPVLIVGGGPTGLLLAYLLSKLGGLYHLLM